MNVPIRCTHLDNEQGRVKSRVDLGNGKYVALCEVCTALNEHATMKALLFELAERDMAALQIMLTKVLD